MLNVNNMENETTFKKTNEAYKLSTLDWVRWGFDLIVFFAERWNEIPKPRSKAQRDSELSAKDSKEKGSNPDAN